MEIISTFVPSQVLVPVRMPLVFFVREDEGFSKYSAAALIFPKTAFFLESRDQLSSLFTSTFIAFAHRRVQTGAIYQNKSLHYIRWDKVNNLSAHLHKRTAQQKTVLHIKESYNTSQWCLQTCTQSLCRVDIISMYNPKLQVGNIYTTTFCNYVLIFLIQANKSLPSSL